MAYEEENNRMSGHPGERNHKAKVTASTVREMRHLRSKGERVSKIARKFGVTHDLAYMAITGRTWGHLEIAERPAKGLT